MAAHLSKQNGRHSEKTWLSGLSGLTIDLPQEVRYIVCWTRGGRMKLPNRTHTNLIAWPSTGTRVPQRNHKIFVIELHLERLQGVSKSQTVETPSLINKRSSPPPSISGRTWWPIQGESIIAAEKEWIKPTFVESHITPAEAGSNDWLRGTDLRHDNVATRPGKDLRVFYTKH